MQLLASRRSREDHGVLLVEGPVRLATECMICLASAIDAPAIFATCGHVFCQRCIHKWLEEKRNCPSCRKRATHDDLVTLQENSKERLAQRLDALKRQLAEAEKACKQSAAEVEKADREIQAAHAAYEKAGAAVEAKRKAEEAAGDSLAAARSEVPPELRIQLDGATPGAPA